MDFGHFLAFPLEQIPYLIVVLAIAFSVHEFAHAYTAYRFGDPTAKKQGRLTLNPLAHLDPVGTLFILLAGFGWAKPVPVNRFFFRNPRLAGVLVSVAGPLSNLLIAAVGMAVWYALVGTGAAQGFSPETTVMLENFFGLLIYLNILLFVFNLLPFPPLDGYRIIEDLSPPDFRVRLTQYEPYGVLLFLFLVITPLDRYILHPIFQTAIPFIRDILHALFSPLLGN